MATLVLILAMVNPAFAEEKKLDQKSEFEAIVLGKELRARGVRLIVGPDGDITGEAYGKPVTGTWSWDDGFFCRSLELGGTKPLRDDCSEVTIEDAKITFTGKRGRGVSAWMTLY